MENKEFLDFDGLALYDENIKRYINEDYIFEKDIDALFSIDLVETNITDLKL